MEILTYTKVYQLVGDTSNTSNEYITKSEACKIADSHRKNVTSDLSLYLDNEYIDIFAVGDKPDLSSFAFTNKRYNPTQDGGTYTTSATSRDIDGNTISFSATSDVDWITDINISDQNITFTVQPNSDDQRIGHITGTNSTGKQDLITVVQEAKAPDVVCTYTLNATCTSVPTVSIEGSKLNYESYNNGVYTYVYKLTVRKESDAPDSVNFTISEGGTGVTYSNQSLSVSPKSWDLVDSLTKDFTVSYSRTKTTTKWDRTSGIINKNSSINVSLVSTNEQDTPSVAYTVTDTAPSGQSFAISKNGMNFTAAASSTDCIGSIVVEYNSLSATIDVTYTRPEETFPDTWSYVFNYNIKSTSGSESTDTKWSDQYYVTGDLIQYDDRFWVSGITSYKTRTGSYGTVQKKDVAYTGSIGKPSGYNYSESEVTSNGTITQSESGNQLTWSYTQEANSKVYNISADPISVHFGSTGGTQSVQVTTWYTWQHNDNNDAKYDEDTATKTITASENKTTSELSWTETLTKENQSIEISCTQDKAQTISLIVPKFSTDGTEWSTTPIVLSWEADDTKSLTYYYRVDIVTQIMSTGEVISTTNYDDKGYTITNKIGDHFNASISGNKVTVTPTSTNQSYTDAIKTTLFITPVGQESNYVLFKKSTFFHQYKGIKVENADMVVFTFGWDDGKDLDNATYVNDHVVGNENKYAGWRGGAESNNTNVLGTYLMFAGDNTGTGKEYTCIDFNALAKYIENHADDESTISGKKLKKSFIDDDGNFVITVDIYNNWYNVKGSEIIELNYSTYNYTQNSVIPSISSTDDKTFVITGAAMLKTNTNNAVCYANYLDGFNNVKNCYTKTAEFTYYLNSGQFYIKTNVDNVSLWNKGFSYKEDGKNYNPEYSNSTSFKNDNINYSIQINSINLPMNKTVELYSYIDVFIQNKVANISTTETIRFPVESVSKLSVFPKVYSYNISTTDLLQQIKEAISNNENFKSNSYITGFTGTTSIYKTDDPAIPEYFFYKNLNYSNTTSLNININ